MTEQFTPTTADVRAAYQQAVGMERNAGPEFDRWLASLLGQAPHSSGGTNGVAR